MVTDPTPIARRRALAGALWRLADLTAVSERRPFRARAFREAAWAVDSIPNPFDASRKQLTATAGIGATTAALVEEFAAIGGLGRLDELLARLPLEAARLAALPRMNLGHLRALKSTLGVDTTTDLIEAIHNEAVETLEGIGPATADRWLQILGLAPTPNAMPAHSAAVMARRLGRHLSALTRPPAEVVAAGGVRRLDEWVLRTELVMVCETPDEALVRVAESAIASSASISDNTVRMTLHDGSDASVTVTVPRRAGTTLLLVTGPPEHVATLDVSEDHSDEAGVYAAAGRSWIPPPARSAIDADVAALIGPTDIRGDLHLHTERSPDGRMSVDEAADAALRRGYEYIAVTDHTVGLGLGGLDAAGLGDQGQTIEAARARFPGLTILHGAEINIDRDGRPDIDDDTLEWLDFVVAGCHSHFDLPRGEQTARLVAAVSHPSVRVLAHPTGRRIGIRPGFDVDLDVVFKAAAAHGTALEVNGHRDRMDLSAESAARAVDAGALLTADGDAHVLAEMANMEVAVGVIQKARVAAASVLNCFRREAILEWLGK